MKAVVLGASGVVGRAAVAYMLAAGVEVLAVGRDPERVAASCPGALVHPGLDLDQTVNGEPLPGAVEYSLFDSADVVLSCAGPSHRYTERVARMALSAGVPLVDPGGERLVATLDPLARATGVSVVLGAGVQPGLSGLAVRVAAARLGQVPQRITGWGGGLQPLTRAGVEEYLEAATLSSRSGQRLTHGVRVGVRPGLTPPVPHPFPSSARAHTHLDEEVERAAAAVGAEHLHWANVTDGAVIEAVLGRCLSGEATLDEAIGAADIDLFGRSAYFHILVEAFGVEERSWARVTCTDSYCATGEVAAALALQTPGAAPGARLASEQGAPLASWYSLQTALASSVRLGAGVGPGFGDPVGTIVEGKL